MFATTVARQIKQDFPGARLSWMIATFCKDIIRENPHVDEVIVTDAVAKNDIVAFRKLKKTLLKEKKAGVWDEVFITHNMDANLALYDGTVRGMIFRAYPFPITVPIQPVLQLNSEEMDHVREYAHNHKLRQFRNVILWEFAPQSGQTFLGFELVNRVAERITQRADTCIILSSARAFTSSNQVLDGSKLSVRENAGLTHYCNLLVGCSSGITWLSTSSAAKELPMLQLLDPGAFFLNAPSVDFKRYDLPVNELVELMDFNEEKLEIVINHILDNGIVSAREKYNQELPMQFKTTRKIVYNLLCYLQFGAIKKHYLVTTSVYGKQPLFIRQFLLGIFSFPFKLIANKFRKWFTSSPGK